MLQLIRDDANDLYLWLLKELVNSESTVSPRGMPVREQLGVQLVLQDVQRSVITWPERKLNYHFMVAEAMWIMLGRDDVEMISHYCQDISKFSDDGKTFFGAYGPPLAAQLPYIKDKLYSDADSRQAVVTLWRQSPPARKDIPCTVAIQFLLRNGKLHGIFTMRSSDAWLGIPYDVFNFSLIINALSGQLGVAPGSLIMQLGSSHLYERNVPAAQKLLDSVVTEPMADPPSVKVPRLHEWPQEKLNFHETVAREDGVCVTGDSPWWQFVEVLAHRKNPAWVVNGFMKELLNGKAQ
jgi:thymidylate synthase